VTFDRVGFDDKSVRIIYHLRRQSAWSRFCLAGCESAIRAQQKDGSDKITTQTNKRFCRSGVSFAYFLNKIQYSSRTRSHPMKIRLIRLLALSITLFAAIPAALATPVIFDFSGANVDWGLTHVFTSGGLSITASGFLVAGGATDLYGKNLGPGEMGVGLALIDTADHEIETTDFVQLDVSDLINHGITSLNLTLSSIQTGESGLIYRTTTAGTLAGATLLTTLTGGADTQSWNVPLTNRYVDIRGGGITGGDVLLVSGTATTVPDGGLSIGLLSMSLLGIAALRKLRD
jgi:hypothetical protein